MAVSVDKFASHAFASAMRRLEARGEVDHPKCSFAENFQLFAEAHRQSLLNMPGSFENVYGCETILRIANKNEAIKDSWSNRDTDERIKAENIYQGLKSGKVSKDVSCHILFWLLVNFPKDPNANAIEKRVFKGTTFDDFFGFPVPTDGQQADALYLAFLGQLDATDGATDQNAERVPEQSEKAEPLSNKALPHLTQEEKNDNGTNFKRWKLTSLEKDGINGNFYNFNLDDSGQRPLMGQPIGALLDITVKPCFTETGLGYTFTKVVFNTSIRTERYGDVEYDLTFQSGRYIGTNGYAVFHGGPSSGFMELTAANGTGLDGTYCFYDNPFLTVSPNQEHYSFFGDLKVNLYDMSLVQADGSALPDATKSAVLRSLLSKEIVPNERNDGVFVLCRQNFVVHSDDPVFIDD